MTATVPRQALWFLLAWWPMLLVLPVTAQTPAMISQAQQLLEDKGFEPGAADGLMGRNTAAAIRAYQQQAGLPVDGKVSEALLRSLSGESTPQPEPAATPPPTRDMIAKAQQLLTEKGFEPGAADGLMGRNTAAAIRAYQQQAGLPADGKVSDALLRSLAGDLPSPPTIPEPALPDQVSSLPATTPSPEPAATTAQPTPLSTSLPAAPQSSADLLWQAARSGDLEGVKKAIAADADLNRQDPDGRTALLITVFSAHPEAAKLLIEAGADVNIQDKRGRTALWAAIFMHQNGVAETLIVQGADVNLATRSGETALHMAVQKNFNDLAQSLIAQGAAVNAADRLGDTPLHNAALFNRAAAAKLLLEHGADLDARTRRGATALTVAELAASAEVARLLRAQGATTP